ncbi:hypothetical protein BGX21_007792, partial [Mortierella sp. AD011]
AHLSREESQKGSIMAMITAMVSSIDVDTVDALFRVVDLLARGSPEFVVLFQDKGYFCTCLLLQNKGVVCRHFFALMKDDTRFQYHLRLVPLRWYTEEHQDEDDIVERVRALELVPAQRYIEDRGVGRRPPMSYPNQLNDFVAAQPKAPKP